MPSEVSPTRAMSRRDLLRWLAIAGGGALLSACNPGGSATPATSPSPPLPPTPSAAAATAIPPSATPAPASDLERLLALVPAAAPALPGQGGVWFGDAARQRRNYGLERVRSLADFDALTPEERTRFLNTAGQAPLPEESGRDRAAMPEFRELVGFDYWQVDRGLSTGDPPSRWSWLGGSFDLQEINRALAAHGHTPRPYGGSTILARGDDGELVGGLTDPLTRLTLARFNRVVVGDGGLAVTSVMGLAQAGIDARAGRAPSLAGTVGYRALARALGPVVGAVLFPPGAGIDNKGRPLFSPYRQLALGLRDDGKVHHMVIGLTYERRGEAEAAAPVLKQRLADYRLLVSLQPLSERATVVEPEISAVDGLTILAQPLQLPNEASLSLWTRMITARDLEFLFA